MAKEIHVKTTVITPKVPNFLKCADSRTISIGDIEDEGLQEIGKAWTEELLARAKEIRASKKGAA